tara:strand:+ start:6423 stop:7088 length:666 start_codon:yes stop_codon:yes gene_type:complete
MYEGIEINHIDTPLHVLFSLSLVIGILLIWLRHGFPREWRLAGWVISDVRRIWQRSADEAPRTGGVIIAHVLGIMAVTTIALGFATALEINVPAYKTLAIGSALGTVTLSYRLLAQWVLGLIPRTKLISKDQIDIDRHLRTWLSAIVGALAIVFSLLPQLLAILGANVFILTWGGWTLFRLLRVFQTSKRGLPHFWWRIVYLCALEILPVAIVIQFIMTIL